MEELGYCRSSGMGVVALDWTELASWSHLTGTYLFNWEYQALMKLSKAYVDQFYKSKDYYCMSPYISEDITQEKRDSISEAFEALAKRLGDKGRK